MRGLFVIIICGSLFARLAGALPAEELRQLWDIPTIEVRTETLKSSLTRGIRVEEIYYYSRPYKREPVRVFGYFCYPQKRAGKLPAILLSHGGGGHASRSTSINWAKKGFAVLAIDLPGKGENRARSRSTGPDMLVATLLRTEPDPSYNYLVHAVAAARNGITYLTQRKEVDRQRIGMIGLSWGGVLTLLTNGQDDRLKAAVNVFGAGYIPEGCTWQEIFTAMPETAKGRWDSYIDPQNFLATQHAPIFFVTGTNDHCYYLPIFQKSFIEVAAGKDLLLIPNLRHKFLAAAERPAFTWLEQQLKTGGTFPRITELPVFRKNANKIIFPFTAAVHSQVKSARLYYTAGGPQGFTGKKWQAVQPYQEADKYFFALPFSILKPEILYYVTFTDDHGGETSTLVRSLFSVKLDNGEKTFALTAPIQRIYRHQMPITLAGTSEGKPVGYIFSKADNAYRTYALP